MTQVFLIAIVLQIIAFILQLNLVWSNIILS